MLKLLDYRKAKKIKTHNYEHTAMKEFIANKHLYKLYSAKSNSEPQSLL